MSSTSHFRRLVSMERLPFLVATASACVSAAPGCNVLSTIRSPLLHLHSPACSSPLLLGAMAAVALTAHVASALATYPHTLSYFNALAGGPLYGSAHLLDGNVDWGQDLLYLKEWYDSHPSSRPLHMAWFGSVHAKNARIDYELAQITARTGPVPNPEIGDSVRRISSGWHAFGMNELFAYRDFGLSPGDYASFHRKCPAYRIGYSVVIYEFSRFDSSACDFSPCQE